VVAHLDPDQVVGVSGARLDRGIRVALTVSDRAVEWIFVEVTTPLPGRPACGGDAGYVTVSCSTGRDFSQVVERRHPSPRLPVYLGRAQSANRGHVLIEVFGEPSAGTRALVASLVDDSLVGLSTTEDLNSDGESIEDFGELDVTREVRRLD
jgi:hypothetical protein